MAGSTRSAILQNRKLHRCINVTLIEGDNENVAGTSKLATSLNLSQWPRNPEQSAHCTESCGFQRLAISGNRPIARDVPVAGHS